MSRHDRSHVHRMEVISWTDRPQPDSPWVSDDPWVLTACTGGVCDKTESIRVSKRDRKIREGLTEEQFKALKAGRYWPEIPELMTGAQLERLSQIYGAAA